MRGVDDRTAVGDIGTATATPGSGSVAADVGEATAPEPDAGDVVIEVRGLTKSFGDVVACRDVSLDLRAGEVLGVVGESGSGKTTLGRCLVGLTAPDRGTIRLHGDEVAASIRRRPASTRRAVQMVFQSPDATLNPRHRVRFILQRAIVRLGGRDDPDRLAGRVRLGPEHLVVRSSRLSGGQKQRVAIARAIAGAPAVVVCDEPVSALDVSVQAAVLDVLDRLRTDDRLAYVFISHDLGVVRYLADRVAVMYRGQVLEVGPAQALFEGAHHPYTHALLEALPTLDGAARSGGRVATSSPGPASTMGDIRSLDLCPFVDRCPYRLPGACDVATPPWRRAGHDHQVRCHLPNVDLPTGSRGPRDDADGRG